MIVVYGGTSSGKSNIAENIATAIAGEERKLFYVATMENKSDAAKERIKHHKELRAGKGFETIEEELSMKTIAPKVENGVVLLECISNLAANIMFAESGEKPIDKSEADKYAFKIYEEIEALNEAAELVAVANNIFSDGYSSDAWVDGYMKVLGKVNELIAEDAEVFIEVTAGIENVIKGEKFWQ